MRLSFAAITDEPPPEVQATCHDRCFVPIKPEHVDHWPSPDPNTYHRGSLGGRRAVVVDSMPCWLLLDLASLGLAKGKNRPMGDNGTVGIHGDRTELLQDEFALRRAQERKIVGLNVRVVG